MLTSGDNLHTHQRAFSLDDLLVMSNEQLGRFDVAWLNLECAAHLPGAEKLDSASCLGHLDGCAALVRDHTDQYFDRFRQHPESCDHSEAIFRMVVLVNCLQQDCGIRYNPDRIHDPDFRDSQDLFVHGLFTGQGGTCASMPVVYVAVGRRLGYPLRLVHAKGHVFVRWDDSEGLTGFPPARVNIEGACRGMNSFADEYYQAWPLSTTPEEREAEHYLWSLTPREELASFLATRGDCLQDNGRLDEAADAYHNACKFAPQVPRYRIAACVNAALRGIPLPEGFEGIAAMAKSEQERIAALNGN